MNEERQKDDVYKNETQDKFTSILEPFKISFKKSYDLDFYRRDNPGYPRLCPKNQYSNSKMTINILNSRKL
jgi:hypothetical protein